jgi:hypothetical protein
MRKYDGLTAEQLLEKGFVSQPDGRLRLRNLWKAQCSSCGKWFGRLKGKECWVCYDRLRNEHVWEQVRQEKRRNAEKQGRANQPFFKKAAALAATRE